MGPLARVIRKSVGLTTAMWGRLAAGAAVGYRRRLARARQLAD